MNLNRTRITSRLCIAHLFGFLILQLLCPTEGQRFLLGEDGLLEIITFAYWFLAAAIILRKYYLGREKLDLSAGILFLFFALEEISYAGLYSRQSGNDLLFRKSIDSAHDYVTVLYALSPAAAAIGGSALLLGFVYFGIFAKSIAKRTLARSLAFLALGQLVDLFDFRRVSLQFFEEALEALAAIWAVLWTAQKVNRSENRVSPQ